MLHYILFLLRQVGSLHGKTIFVDRIVTIIKEIFSDNRSILIVICFVVEIFNENKVNVIIFRFVKVFDDNIYIEC